MAEALESVLAQGYRPLEAIVVDDGSTDATAGDRGRLRAPVPRPRPARRLPRPRRPVPAPERRARPRPGAGAGLARPGRRLVARQARAATRGAGRAPRGRARLYGLRGVRRGDRPRRCPHRGRIRGRAATSSRRSSWRAASSSARPRSGGGRRWRPRRCGRASSRSATTTPCSWASRSAGRRSGSTTCWSGCGATTATRAAACPTRTSTSGGSSLLEEFLDDFPEAGARLGRARRVGFARHHVRAARFEAARGHAGRAAANALRAGRWHPGVVARADRERAATFLEIGTPGFEPGTSCSQSRRANQAALRPVRGV